MSRALNLAVLALMVLATLTPAAGVAQQAQPQMTLTCLTAGCQPVTLTKVRMGVGDEVLFRISDPAKVGYDHVNVTMELLIGGAVAYKASRVPVYNVTEYEFEGRIRFERFDTYVLVVYIDARGREVPLTSDDGRRFVFEIVPAQTVVLRITYTYIDVATGAPAELTAEIEYIPPPVKFFLEVAGRKYYGNVYWLPRLGAGGEIVPFNSTAAYDAAAEWRIVSTHPVPSWALVDIFARKVGADGILCSATGVNFSRVGTYELAPASDADAEKIKEFLECLSQRAAPWYIEGTDYASPVRTGDYLELWANVTAGGTTYVTEVERAVVFVSISRLTFTALSFTSPLVTVTLHDPDANLDTSEAEAYPFTLNLTQDGSVRLALTLVETGPNTGVFVARITIFQLYEAGLISEFDNVVDYVYYEVRIDEPGRVVTCVVDGRVEAVYHDGTYTVLEKNVTLRDVERCCPPLKITISIDDPDLRLPGQDIVAVAEVPPGGTLTNVVAYYYYAGSLTGVPALNFTVVAVDEEGTAYDLVVPEGMTIYFIQKAGGTVEAVIDLAKADWRRANLEALEAGRQLVAIKVVITERFTTALSLVTHEATVEVQRVSISADRTVIPISFKVVSAQPAGVWTPIGRYPSCYKWVEDGVAGDVQRVRITIVDPGRNENCCEVERITPGVDAISMVLQLKVGDEYVTAASASVQGTSLLMTVPLVVEEETGWETVGACYFRLSELTETGINTGVFVGTLDIWSEITLRTAETEVTLRVAGCPSAWLQDARLVITYTSSAIGRASLVLTFSMASAELEVSETAVTYGETVTVTVVDPDANLDSAVNDTVSAIVRFYCAIMGEYYEVPITLVETGPDTGVFVGSFVVNSTYAGPCGDLYAGVLEVVYLDRTPFIDHIVQSELNQLLQMYTLGYVPGLGLKLYAVYGTQYCGSVALKTSMPYEEVAGEVELYYRIEIPGLHPWDAAEQEVSGLWIPPDNRTVLKIVVIDPDLNRATSLIDNLTGSAVAIYVEGLMDAPITLTDLFGDVVLRETDVSTASFVWELTLRQLIEALKLRGYDVSLDKLAGRTIKVIYYERWYAPTFRITPVEAATTVFEMTGEVEVVNATTGEPGTVFRCQCVGPNCPPAGGDIITIYVRDVTLLRYVPSAVSLPGNLSLRLVAEGEVRPLEYGGIEALRYVGYYNLTLTAGDKSVMIPVPVYTIENVVIYCTRPTAPPVGQSYIVANFGQVVRLIYHDKVGAAGEPVDVVYEFSIGTVAPPRPVALTYEMRIWVEGRGIPSFEIKRGLPATIKVELTYDPLWVRATAGITEMEVVMLLINEEGVVVVFDYLPVDITVHERVVTFKLSTTLTEALEPGKYTVRIIVVDSTEYMRRLSEVYEFEVTVTD